MILTSLSLNKRIKTSTMKKFLVVIALAGVFTACGNGSESSTSTDSTSADSSSNMMSTPSTSDTSSSMMGGSSDTSSRMMGDTSMRSDSTRP